MVNQQYKNTPWDILLTNPTVYSVPPSLIQIPPDNSLIPLIHGGAATKRLTITISSHKYEQDLGDSVFPALAISTSNASGTENTYIFNVPQMLDYHIGLELPLMFHRRNTGGAVNVNINGKGNRRVYQADNSNPAADVIQKGTTHRLRMVADDRFIICRERRVLQGHISALVQDLTYYHRTERYETRQHPYVYYLGNKVPTAIQQRQLGIDSEFRELFKYSIDIGYTIHHTQGSANNYTIVLPKFTGYYKGLTIPVSFHAANAAGACYVDVNSVSQSNIYRNEVSVLPAGTIRKDSIWVLYYNGKDFELRKSIDEEFCGWIHPSRIYDVLKGYREVTVNGETWFEKYYGYDTYKIRD